MLPETEEQTLKAESAFVKLDRSIYTALETYSNVHRGSGHNSIVTTHLYDKARDIVLEYLGLEKINYTVVFCTPFRAEVFQKQLNPGHYVMLVNMDTGLSLGICAIAVEKKTLPKGIPFQTGGGTAKLSSEDWVIWTAPPDRFEAGTPQIINVIAFARALTIIRESGKNAFINDESEAYHLNDILYNDDLTDYSGQELLERLKSTLIGYNKEVPTAYGNKSFLNLDNSASTQTFEPVFESFRRALRLNEPVKQELIQEVKSICSGFLNAPIEEYDVLFTSNTTESINLASQSFENAEWGEIEPVVLATTMEHTSNDLPWRMLKRSSIIRLNVNGDGFIDLNELESILILYNQQKEYGNKRIKLITVSGASNVLGTCNNVKEIARLAHHYGAYVMVDAAQLIAHRKIDIQNWDIDFLAFSAHKVYAPFGSGVLIARKGLLNFKQEYLELIKQSGEENAGGIAALGKILLLMQRIGMDLIIKDERAITRKALLALKDIPGIKVYGIKDPDSPDFHNKAGVIAFSSKKIYPDKLGKQLAIVGGIGIRYGCHCAHILVKRLLNFNPVLERIQWTIQVLLPKLQLPGVARISFGIPNSEGDIERFIITLKKVISEKSDTFSSGNTPVFSDEVVKQQIKDFTKDAEVKVYG